MIEGTLTGRLCVAGFGRYKLGKRLGEGQYGTVWEATDIKTGFTYAAKVAAFGYSGASGSRSMFFILLRRGVA